ncbi:ribonuclease H-like domain-containing protein, partial [Pelagophyceae sp. CCMP2097]
VFGLDCEMVTSARGPELARCTLVDEAGEVILDELVKPSVAVTDYCTRWSGLDEKRLRHVTTTLDQCRAAVLQIVRKTDVLVGHSMDNDLRCLRLAHAFCGDTALLYGHARGSGYKRSLRHLSAEFLQRAIQ